MINREQVIESIKKNKELPTLFEFYEKLRKKLPDPKTSAAEIASLISSDQAVVSHILRTANSSFYGFMSRITTVPHAIVVIGFSGIQYLVLNMAVFNFFEKVSRSFPHFGINQLWKHSSGVAVFSRIIARRTHYPNTEEMFTAGLLHDIGKVFVMENFPDDFMRVISEVNTRGIAIAEAEGEVLGINHSEIGRLLLEQWHLPDTLIFATAYHHNPVLAQDKMKAAAIVHLADILCRAIGVGYGGDEKVPRLSDEGWTKLGIEKEVIPGIISEYDEEAKHTMTIV